jgi:hypothetical protein
MRMMVEAAFVLVSGVSGCVAANRRGGCLHGATRTLRHTQAHSGTLPRCFELELSKTRLWDLHWSTNLYDGRPAEIQIDGHQLTSI